MVGSYLIALDKLGPSFQYKKVMTYGIVIKKNDEFANLEICWKDKRVKVFYDENLNNLEEIKVGDLVKVRGTFKEYNGQEQIFSDFIIKVDINLSLLEKILDYIEKNFYIKEGSTNKDNLVMENDF